MLVLVKTTYKDQVWYDAKELEAARRIPTSLLKIEVLNIGEISRKKTREANSPRGENFPYYSL